MCPLEQFTNGFYYKNSVFKSVKYKFAVQWKNIKNRKVVEVQSGDLVGQYLSTNKGKTSSKINEAKGGVLYVDEAYHLTPRSSSTDYGCMAINELMAAMEKGKPVMICAGYPAKMKEFLKSNPGFYLQNKI